MKFNYYKNKAFINVNTGINQLYTFDVESRILEVTEHNDAGDKYSKKEDNFEQRPFEEFFKSIYHSNLEVF